MNVQKIIHVAWPAFLAASAMEMLVFGFVDPGDIAWLGHPLSWSRQGVYSVAFFAFWLVAAAACWMTSLLIRAPDDVNRAG